VSGALGYFVEVAILDDGERYVVYELSTDATQTTYDPGYYCDLEHYWRVRVVEPESGPWSQESAFVVEGAQAPSTPTFLSPSNGAQLACGQIELTWVQEDIGEVDYFYWEMEILDGGESWVLYDWNAVYDTYDYVTVDCNHAYRWRVLAIGLNGAESPFSQFAYFDAYAYGPQPRP
jgi:hypothetical protein